MASFLKSLTWAIGSFDRAKRKNESTESFLIKKKIKIIEPSYISTSPFEYEESPEQHLINLENFMDPTRNSTETIRACLDLVNETIRYAKKKIKKLTNDEKKIEAEINEEEEQKVYDDWYNSYSSSDIKCLSPGQEITSKVVEKYIKIQQFQKYFACLGTRFYKIAGDHFSNQIDQRSVYQMYMNRFGLESLLDKDYVIVPVKENGWSLVLIDNKNKVLEFYSSDSFTDFSGPCSKIEKVLTDFENTENYDWEMMESPEELSKNDSGVFMLLMLKALALNVPFEFSPEKIEYYRTLISVELNRNS